MSRKHSMTKACEISAATRAKVAERDGYCCIICGSSNAEPNSHYIKKGQGGLGIAENVGTMCIHCHHEYDNGKNPEPIKRKFRTYLQACYPDWDESKLYYNKWGWCDDIQSNNG